MQRKTVLLLPSSYYLSDEVFVQIAQNSHYQYIYLDPKDSSFKKINSKHKEAFNSHKFEACLELAQDIYSGSNFFLRWVSLQIKKNQIIRIILKLKPDLIIATTDGTFAARVIARFLPQIPFIILQTALISADKDKYKLPKKSFLKNPLFRFFGNRLFPLGSPVQPFGLNHSRARVLLWGASSEALIRPLIRNQKLHLVGNSIFAAVASQALPKKSVLFLAPDARDQEESLEFCNHVQDIAQAFPHLHFQIRLHPVMDPAVYRDYFAKEKLVNVEFMSPSLTLRDSILAANVVISQYSAATLDAIAMGRHVILYKKINEHYLSHWFERMDLPKTTTTRGVIESLMRYESEGVFSGQGPSSPSIGEHWYAVGDASLKNILAEIDLVLKEQHSVQN